MFMIRFLVLAAVLACLSAMATADQSASVVRLEDHAGDGKQTTGSAVLIGGGYALTAEHCSVGQLAFITHPTQATLVFDPVKNGIDEAKLIRVDADTRSIATIGPTPKVGDRVYGIGYPHGVFEKYEGTVLSISDQTITTDLRVDHGASGGGLFNDRDELIGICSAKNESGSESYWIHTDSLRRAVSNMVPTQSPPAAYDRDTRVIVLSLKGCGPCEVLKRDIADGKFPGFTFEVTTYDAAIGTWDKPELHAAFVAECKAPRFVAAPTIWVPGTGKYKEGYDTRPGLIGWFEDVVRLIFRGPPPMIPIVGQSATPAMPLVGLESPSEVASLRDQLAKLKADYEAFRDAGVFGKIQAVAAMKEDKAAIESSIAEIHAATSGISDGLAEVKNLRDQLAKLRADYAGFRDAGLIDKVKSIAALKEDAVEIKSSIDSIRESAQDAKQGPMPAIISSLVGLVTGVLHHLFGRKQGSV